MENNYVKVVKGPADMERAVKVDEMAVEVIDTREEFEFDRISYPPEQKFKQAYSHKAEEAAYLIRGCIDYELGGETVRMREGDWIWHPSYILHNTGNPEKNSTGVLLFGEGPSVWLHPEVDEDLVKRQPHPKIAGVTKPYLYVPAGACLDKREVDGVILKTRILAPRVMGYEIVFPKGSLQFKIKPNLFEGNSLLYVLEGEVSIEVGETKDVLGPDQSVSFSSSSGCLGVSKGSARVLMYNIGGRYYVPGQPEIKNG
ncbi:MAG: cupin domain-containing protein [Elusimicrobia bacterium]|nr:cupin domain-containing protein [Elusimicrobiota bacterium]